MPDYPEAADAVKSGSDAMGAAALVLWTELARRLVEKELLSRDDVHAVIQAAHGEFAKEQGSEAVMALLARLDMNAL